MTEYTGNDIYCDIIIPRKVDLKVVKETENILAFHHTKPSWPVHVVVTPKIHVASLVELEGELASELFSVLKEVARDVQVEHGAAKVVTNLGDYQDSKHLHIHVVSGSKVR
jgi:histidine triad (HIT) family protein